MLVFPPLHPSMTKQLPRPCRALQLHDATFPPLPEHSPSVLYQKGHKLGIQRSLRVMAFSCADFGYYLIEDHPFRFMGTLAPSVRAGPSEP